MFDNLLDFTTGKQKGRCKTFPYPEDWEWHLAYPWETFKDPAKTLPAKKRSYIISATLVK
jgi:hypothetical protein